MRKNRYRKLLNSELLLEAVSSEVPPNPDFITSRLINLDNSEAAGLFSDFDISELDKRIAREAKAREGTKKPKPFVRVTVQNATKEQVQAALHKLLPRVR